MERTPTSTVCAHNRPHSGSGVSWNAAPGSHPGLQKWAGIGCQKAGQDLGPPAWDPTVRYQAGGPRRMPGKWPHIVGPPDQPGEGGGWAGRDTLGVLCSFDTRRASDCAAEKHTRLSWYPWRLSQSACTENLKNRGPQLPRRSMHSKILDPLQNPCLAARSTSLWW